MAVKKPGFDNSAGNRNRRVNRYANAGDNKSDRLHKIRRVVTVAFVSPDQITDSANGLDRFTDREMIKVQGSVAQDGNYEIDTVVQGQIDTVEQGITAEIAGPEIAINSRNNNREYRI